MQVCSALKFSPLNMGCAIRWTSSRYMKWGFYSLFKYNIESELYLFQAHILAILRK